MRMEKGLLPGQHANHRTGPQRTKQPGYRFQPYNTGLVPRERSRPISHPGLETPQLPKQSEPKSKTPSEAADVDDGYESDPVEAYDVDWNQTAAVTADTSDYEKWNEAPAEFIRSYSGVGDEWVGKRPLGAGGFGLAGLWEKYDDNGAVVEVNSMYT